jgi:secondary thiamine-phosphate synthase enzyme
MRHNEDMAKQRSFIVDTRGRGTCDISDRVEQAVAASGVDCGIAHVFVHHTSASLLLCENADPQVRRDLEAFLARLVPDGSPLFEHQDEGPDDMPAHIRAILTKVELSVPVTGGRCALGTWQGIYLYEHRTQGHRRRVTVTVL